MKNTSMSMSINPAPKAQDNYLTFYKMTAKVVGGLIILCPTRKVRDLDLLHLTLAKSPKSCSVGDMQPRAMM